MRRFLPALLLLGACSGAPPKGEPRSNKDEAAFDMDLTVALAETLVQSGAHTNALPMLRDALRRKPNDPRLHYLLGTILRDRGLYEQAQRTLDKAVSLDPTLSPAWAALGMVHDLQRRPAAALRCHDKAIELSPEVGRFFNNRGFSKYLAGDPAGAASDLQEALRLEPTAARVYVNLGFALAAQGKDEEALRMFRQALDEAGALNNLALAHELRGEPSSALAMYRRALEIDPGQDEALLNLEALSAEAPVATEVR